jgi:hypothetical protein
MASEWRQLAPWPDDLRFHDTRTERILETQMPPRPVVSVFASTGSMCTAARFAESELDARVGRGN